MSMKVRKLSESEMLNLWKLKRGMASLRDDAVITRSDGMDMDTLLLSNMRGWYDRVIRTASADVLPLADVTNRLEMTVAPSGVAVVKLPDDCVRVVRVMAEGWERQAEITTDVSGVLAQEQMSEYTRGGAVNPVAVVDGGEMRLYTLGDGAKLEQVLCVMSRSDDGYLMTDWMEGEMGR